MTHQKKNIETFNKFVAEFLKQLYSHFPVKKDYKLEDYDYLNNVDDSDIFFSSIRFLQEENYIRVKHPFGGGFSGVCLTAKGLDVLNSKPISISKSGNVAALIQDSLKSGSKEAIKSAINEVIKVGATYISNKVKDE